MSGNLTNFTYNISQKIQEPGIPDYYRGYNEGLIAGAQRLEMYITILVICFAAKILIQLPFLQKRLPDQAVDYVVHISDVVAFGVSMLMLYFSMGNPVFG